MKNKPLTYRFAAFSILEVTVVIALMALLSALFFAALNRFNEQVRNETMIKNELNHWFMVRSNLWRELDEADSIRVTDNKALIYLAGVETEYSIAADKLVRRTGETTTPFEIEMAAIKQEKHDGSQCVDFQILWKNEEMILSYPLKSSLADRINKYYREKEWQ